MAYWNDLEGGRRAPRRQKQSGADSVRALKAQVDARRQAVIDGIQNKILYANAIGRPDPSLIPMGALNKAGIEAQQTAQGLPYGLDPRSLTADEREYLGIGSALDGLYGGG